MEKRIFVRHQVDYPVRIKMKNEVSLKKVVNLSEKGLGLETSGSLPDTSVVHIEIDLTPRSCQTKLEGKIIWKNWESGEEKFRYGILCVNPPDIYTQTVRKLLEDNKKGYFLFELTVYLKETSMFGNVYFSRYFDWQGTTREAYLRSMPRYKEVLGSGVKMITKSASIEYLSEAIIFDEIAIRLQSKNIKRCSFGLDFVYFNKKTMKLVARGEQTVTFTDRAGKITPIPLGVFEVITKHVKEEI